MKLFVNTAMYALLYAFIKFVNRPTTTTTTALLGFLDFFIYGLLSELNVDVCNYYYYYYYYHYYYYC